MCRCRPVLAVVALWAVGAICSAPLAGRVHAQQVGRGAAGSEAKSAQTCFTRGCNYYSEGHLDSAIAEFSEAIRFNPNYAAAYFRRGQAHERKGESGKADADFDKAVHLDFKFWLLQGEITKRRELDATIAELGEAIGRNPEDVQAYYRRGETYVERASSERTTAEDGYAADSLQKAVADFTAVIRLAPDDTRGYSKRGETHVIAADYQKAVEDFSQAIRIAPRGRGAYMQRGEAYRLMRDFPKALADYQSVHMPFLVQVLDETASLRIAGEVTATAAKDEELQVTRIKGDWLWIEPVLGTTGTKRGWIDQKHVH